MRPAMETTGRSAAGLAVAAENPPPRRHGLFLLLAAWLVLSALLTLLATRNVAVPGLNYDEAVYGHFAKSFLTGRSGPSLPASQVVPLFGRPFPLFLQAYLGALKSWMLLPGLALFGYDMTTMRLTVWAWAVFGLLFYMLWLRRTLGTGAAALGGFVLGLDPSFYFISICDWGPVVPSFLCRFAGFCFAVRWWRERRGRDLFLAGLALGLGLFSKVDFVVVLAGCGAALLAIYFAEIRQALRDKPSQAAWGAAGFVLGAGLVAKNALTIAQSVLGGSVGHPNDAMEKAQTFRTMFDGSYFYRLMESGGHFDRMFDAPVPVWGPFGLVFALACALLGLGVLRGRRGRKPERFLEFLLLSAALVLLGTWLLPGAIRIHHWTLVYPLPHVIVVAAALRLWRGNDLAGRPRGLRLLAAVLVAAVLGGHLVTIQKTEQLLAETGGRGLWSNALNAFAAEVRDRKDLTIVSYDWGFHEPLAFLTDGPTLVEPIWADLPAGRFVIPTAPNVIHLIHPPDVQVFPLSGPLLRRVSAAGPQKVSVRVFTDRTGRPAFYAIRFLAE